MAVTLSAVVMAHPKRRQQVNHLVARIGDVPVVWDQNNDVWDTGRRALLAYEPGASHHLVVQDDADVRGGLLATCQTILEHTPHDVPVSLYMGRWRYRPVRFNMNVVVATAREQSASFAVFGGPWWGPGIILPTSHIPAVVAYGDENPHREPNYDLRIAQFYKSKGVDCWYTMPSVVDHQNSPSLVGRRGLGRHAAWFSSDGNWDGGAITPEDMRLVRPFPKTP